MKKKLKFLILLVLIAVTAGLVTFYSRIENYFERMRTDRENRAAVEFAIRDTAAAVETVSRVDAIPVIPDKAYIRVPFVCQAPLQNQESWDFHHASCEEAAVLQALYYARGIDTIHPKEAHQIFLDMIAWQEKHFGLHKDIHADSVRMLMTGFFGLQPDEVIIRRKATLSDIRRFVAEGYPVIAPTYGRTLKNPYYTPPGPEYHMVTVIGYTPDRIITNDVGTKRGKDFSYENERFMKSMNQEGADILIIRLKKK